MKPVCDRLAVLGLGLLGASLALAARERGLAGRVVGATRSAAARAEVQRRGMVDALEEPEAAVAGADLVVLATPVAAMPELLARVAGRLAPGCVVTDVGSVKGELARLLPPLLPAGAVYLGSHPMAGSHLRGPEAARADLFEGAACVLMEGGAPEAEGRLRRLWEGLGGRVLRRSPEAHDREVAWISHLPHLLAFAFARSLEAAPGEAFGLCASGFRDFTRIARSDAGMWADILTANRGALRAPLQEVQRRIDELARALEQDETERAGEFIAAAREVLERETGSEVRNPS